MNWFKRLFSQLQESPTPGAAAAEVRTPKPTPQSEAATTPPAPPAPLSPKGPPRSRSTASGAEPALEPSPTSANRIIRVFISSTFRDMIEDRDELMAQAWPALRSLCRERSVEFVEVDLRWGITEEQSQRKETVRHCLAEIERCRPYFIALLGERYGWVPGPEAYSSDLLEEEGWLEREIAKKRGIDPCISFFPGVLLF